MGQLRVLMSTTLALVCACLMGPNVRAAGGCGPLSAPSGTIITVSPSQAAELRTIVAGAPEGATILLESGNYPLQGEYLWFSEPRVTLRGKSGVAEDVVLDGGYETTEVITVQASDVTIADLTIWRAYTHGIHVFPSTSGDISGTRIHNVRIIDPAEQAIKINANGGHYADYGEISCSHLELTDAGRAHVRNDCYTGGVDGHQVRGWVVRDCTIRGFWCPEGLSEHAIHFWTGSRDTVIERNVLVDNVRGIGLGLVQSGSARTYGDDPCPAADGYVDHYGGIVRNNAIYQGSSELYTSEYGFDCGICLAQACNAQVWHNSIFSSFEPFNSIEWRFRNTSAVIGNNLVSHRLLPREGAQASLFTNVQDATADLFVHPSSGDLHLRSAEPSVVDAGTPPPAGICDDDMDGDSRPWGSGHDIGADEWRDALSPVYLPLVEGWNLVSLPVLPSETTTEAVLASIAGHYGFVFAWPEIHATEWQWYDPQAPDAGPLRHLDGTGAFWLMMRDAADLLVVGVPRGETTHMLRPGWNLVPGPAESGGSVTDLLAEIDGHYDLVLGYDPSRTNYWTHYAPGIPPWGNTLSRLESGKGYYIHALDEVTIRM